MGLLSLVAATALAQKFQDEIATAALDLHEHFYQIALVFFGVSCVANGTAMVRTAMPTPKALGVLFGIAGVGYVVDSVGLLFLPEIYDGTASPFLMLPALVSEVWFAMWLVYHGCRTRPLVS